MSDTITEINTPLSQDFERLSQLPVPIAIVNRNGVIKFANDQAERDYFGEPIYSQNQGELTGRNITEILASPTIPSGLRSLYKEVFKTERQFQQKLPTDKIHLPEVTVIRADGRRRIVQLKPQQVGDLANRDFQIVIEDITEWKRSKALERAGRLIQSTLDLDQVLTNVREILSTIIDHDTANLMLFEGDNLLLTHKWGYGENGPVTQKSNSTTVAVAEKPLLKRMLETGEPLSVPNTHNPDFEYRQTAFSTQNNSYVGSPIIAHGKIIGFLNLNNRQKDRYTEDDASLLKQFADVVGIAIDHARTHQEVTVLSTTDGLTGLVNRRHLDELSLVEIRRAIRYGRPLSTLMLDIDDFKPVNDTYGHLAGDDVLKQVAHRCRDKLRDIDIAGRYGGEEFEFDLPETAMFRAYQTAEKLRAIITSEPVSISTGVTLNKTVSIGIATLMPRQIAKEELNNQYFEQIQTELRHKADEALYVVKKHGGKNAVGVYLDLDIKNGINANQVAIYKPLNNRDSWEIEMYDPTGEYRVRKRFRIYFLEKYKNGSYDAYRYSIFDLLDGDKEHCVGNLDFSQIHYSLTGYADQLGEEMLLSQDKQAIKILFPSYTDKD